MPHRLGPITLALATLAITQSLVRATDILGVESAALDQPRINAYISLTPTGSPLTADLGGDASFNIQAYYDTGASGVLLSTNTAELLGLTHATYNGQDVIYSDVGVAGSDNFFVSNPLYISLAKFHPNADVDNPNTYANVYTQRFGQIRTQIGPANVEPDPATGDLDVFGMPTMAGKVVVMDPRPVNSFLDTMRTYVYNPGTAYNAGARDTDPGIPTTDRHVKLSYVSFDRFTKTTPSGATAPTLRNNPFIGPNPFVANDATPKVKIAYDGHTTEGSFLLDTGAAASIISTGKAGALGVTYDPATLGSANPVLMYEGQPIDNQFQLTIGGIGGTKVVTGFYLSSLLLRTDEGNAANDDDPSHIRFLDAPVLVSDISVQNPNNASDTYTLDGIFGMNYLVASAALAGTDANGFPLIGNLSRGKFDWVTFDEPNGRLGLTFAAPAPQNQLQWFGDIFGETPHWDTTSSVWVSDSGLDAYHDGDQVVFGSIAFADTIRLNETVVPGGVTFENDYDPDDDSGINYDLIGTGKISGFGGLIKRGSGMLEIHTSNDYTGATVVEAGNVIFYGSQNIGSLAVHSGAEVRVATANRHAFESIDVAGTMSVVDGARIVTQSISVDPNTGQLDLGNAKLIVDVDPGEANPSADIRAALAAGSHNGAWNGHGLISRTAAADGRLAIGYITAADKFGSSFPATWNGEILTDGSAVLVAVVLRGDANLSGGVGFDDLLALAKNYNKTSGRVWSQGDFDYNGAVNFNDLLALAKNYNRTAAAADGSSLLAAGVDGSFAQEWALAQSLVPEPTSLAASLGLALIALRRTRKTSR